MYTGLRRERALQPRVRLLEDHDARRRLGDPGHRPATRLHLSSTDTDGVELTSRRHGQDRSRDPGHDGAGVFAGRRRRVRSAHRDRGGGQRQDRRAFDSRLPRAEVETEPPRLHVEIHKDPADGYGMPERPTRSFAGTARPPWTPGRRTGITEVENVMTEEQARHQAERCLSVTSTRSTTPSCACCATAARMSAPKSA